MKKSTPNAPPAGLSVAAKGWWKKLMSEYEIQDAAGLLLLETALQAMDRMNEARALIEKHGAVTLDRFSQLRPNPATTVERDSRAAMLSSLKSLNLDLEPLRDGVGRPPGGTLPTNRKRRGRNLKLDDCMFSAMVFHVETGDCLLAGAGLGCGCGLRGEDGEEREELIRQVKERMETDC